jgi:hypothetical protein
MVFVRADFIQCSQCSGCVAASVYATSLSLQHVLTFTSIVQCSTAVWSAGARQLFSCADRVIVAPVQMAGCSEQQQQWIAVQYVTKRCFALICQVWLILQRMQPASHFNAAI